MLRSLFALALLLHTAPAVAQDYFEGDRLRIWYGVEGLWNDTTPGVEAGLQIDDGTDTWRDVTYPITPWSGMSLGFTSGAARSRYFIETAAATNRPAGASAMPDPSYQDRSASGLYLTRHTYGAGFLEVRKWEAWAPDDQSIYLHFTLINGGSTPLSNIALVHGIDPDQDTLAPSSPNFVPGSFECFNTTEDASGDGRLDYTSSEGVLSGWTVAYGSCDAARQDVGHFGALSIDPDLNLATLNGVRNDHPMYWRHTVTTLAPGEEVDFGMIFTWDVTATLARSRYLAEVSTFCNLADQDGDGFRNALFDGDDCDDTDPLLNIDCDPDTDIPLDTDIPDDGLCFEDLDGDGWGSSIQIESDNPDCDGPGESPLTGDCDDTDPTVYPGAPEVPNDGIDQNCDGSDLVIDAPEPDPQPPEPLEPSPPASPEALVPTGGFRGCASVGDHGGRALLVFGLMLAALRLRRRRSVRGLALLLCGGALALAPAPAQAQPSGDLNIQLYEQPGLASGFLGVTTARFLPGRRFAFEATGNYAWRPFQLARPGENRLTEHQGVVDHLGAMHLRMAGTPTPWLQIAVHAPVLQGVGWPESPNSLIHRDPNNAPLAVGDVTLDVGLLAVGEDRGVGVAFIPFVTIPTGRSEAWLTHGVPTFGGRFAMSGQAGPVHLATSVGYRVLLNAQPLTGRVAVDDRVLFSGGVGFELIPEAFRLNVEAFGSSVVGPSMSDIVRDPFTAGLHTPLEVGGSLLVNTRPGFAIAAGGYAGLTSAVGTPAARALLTLGYNPISESDRDGDGIPDRLDACPRDPEDFDGFEDADGCPDPDNDGDGIPDVDDDCPDDPEDFDGFEDEDGCPDPDNDGDRIPDVRDACPDDPEDYDGFEDEDGCPDPDNDGDGIPDHLDACPDDPEDFDGFQDEDGCPEEDNDRDGDGIPDHLDACPDDPEDFDGFEDEDGCPDPDNDGDGIPDHLDLCPNEPENFNDYMDEDGCPDEVLAVVTEDRIVILDKVFFETAEARILKKSFKVLDAVYDTLSANPQIERLRIEGHTDSQGSDAYNLSLSQRRAQSVRDYLVHRGIDPARLFPVGFGELYPLATNRTPEGRERNRRVEFHIVKPGADPLKPGRPDPTDLFERRGSDD